MNEGEHRLAAEVEKLIEKYQPAYAWEVCQGINSDDFTHFKWELRNIITKYE